MADGDSGRSVGLADVLSRFIQEMIHLVPRPLNPDTSTEMMQHIRDTLRALYTDVFRFLTEPDDSPLLPIGSASDEITIRIRGLKFLMTGVFEVLYERIRVTSVDKSDHIHLYVRKWFKFQELQLVLSASMQEIVDRWSSGKGPLASHFSADEVKHLIRALFQNTERRAAALGRIH